MTRERLQRLVDAAMCTIDTCEEDQCARFATWEAWEHGRQHKSLQVWCDAHVPPCTEERGGLCKQGCDGYRLAQELNALLDEADQHKGDARRSDNEGKDESK